MNLRNQVASTAPAIAFVQGKGTANLASSLAFTSSNTAGNMLVFAIETNAVGSPTDTAGNGWVKADGGANSFLQLFYCSTCKGGANTVSWSGGGVQYMVTGEFSGVNSIDQRSGDSGANSGAITTLFANELLLGVSVSGSSGATITTASYAYVGGSAFSDVALAYKIVSAIQTGVTAGGGGSGTQLVSFYTPTVNPNSISGS